MTGKSYPTKGDIIIGNDVCIGHGTTLMPGVQIGDGAIIATKAIVTKNLEPYTIVGGNPAKPIHKRFSKNTIANPLELQWWHWDIEKITQNVNKLTTKPEALS